MGVEMETLQQIIGRSCKVNIPLGCKRRQSERDWDRRLLLSNK